MPQQQRLRVLVAEDNRVNQRLAVALLEARGHSVVVAPDGREAIAAYARESFDLVLMDVLMPEIDGYEAATAIRAYEQGTGRHVPIIAVTAHAMQGDRQRCVDAGMDGYVSKPIRREELQMEIERVCTSKSADAVERGAPVVAVSGEPAPAGQEPIQRRFQDDEALLRELAAIFLEDCPERMAAIADALAREDAGALVQAAHSLKGAVSVICDNGPTPVVRELETAARAGKLSQARACHCELERQIERLRQDLTSLLAPVSGVTEAV